MASTMQSIEGTRLQAPKDACSDSDSAPLQVFNTPEILANILGHFSADDFLTAHQAHQNFLAVVKQFPALRRQFSIERGSLDARPHRNPLFSGIARSHDWLFFLNPCHLTCYNIHNNRRSLTTKPKPNKKWMEQLDGELLLSDSPDQFECFVTVGTDLVVTKTTFTLEPKECFVSVIMHRLEQVREQTRLAHVRAQNRLGHVRERDYEHQFSWGTTKTDNFNFGG